MNIPNGNCCKFHEIKGRKHRCILKRRIHFVHTSFFWSVKTGLCGLDRLDVSPRLVTSWATKTQICHISYIKAFIWNNEQNIYKGVGNGVLFSIKGTLFKSFLLLSNISWKKNIRNFSQKTCKIVVIVTMIALHIWTWVSKPFTPSLCVLLLLP